MFSRSDRGDGSGGYRGRGGRRGGRRELYREQHPGGGPAYASPGRRWQRGRGRQGGRGRGAGDGGGGRVSLAPPYATSQRPPPPISPRLTPAVSASSPPPPVAADLSALAIQEMDQISISVRNVEELKISSLAPIKGSRLPPRQGIGLCGKKCIVKANHFLVEVADRNLCHYDRIKVAVARKMKSTLDL